jgi:hypothetical protein
VGLATASATKAVVPRARDRGRRRPRLSEAAFSLPILESKPVTFITRLFGWMPPSTSLLLHVVPDKEEDLASRASACPIYLWWPKIRTPFGSPPRSPNEMVWERGAHGRDLFRDCRVVLHGLLFAVPVRWVLVRDPKGEFKTQALLCTDLEADPQKIVCWFVMRWQLEVTFQEMRRHLGFETQRQWSDLWRYEEPHRLCWGCSRWSPCLRISG